MEEDIFNKQGKSYSIVTKKYNPNTFNLTEEDDMSLRFRSNSCLIPSLNELSNCLDFVPKLK